MRRTADGWTAEVAVSAGSLRFRPGLASWGLNVERFVARDRLTLRWAGASLDAQLGDLRRVGALGGVAALRQGVGLAVAPYALGRTEQHDGSDGRLARGDAGFDLSYNLTPQLGTVLTVNTDFAETEVDARQINLTRFSLFFPEKRPFFLEGSNLFAFGSGLEETFIPFYSRQVGLVRGRVIPLGAGLKLLGRTGPFALSLLDVETGSSPAAPTANLFAGRITWDLDAHLRVGALATRGDPQSERGATNSPASTPFGRPPASRGTRTSPSPPGQPRATATCRMGGPQGWGARVDYPNDLWDVSLQFVEFGDALDPALGFLPRPGPPQLSGGLAYQPRPQEDGALLPHPPILLRALPQPGGAARRHHRELARVHGAVRRLHPFGRAPGSQLGAAVRAPGRALRGGPGGGRPGRAVSLRPASGWRVGPGRLPTGSRWAATVSIRTFFSSHLSEPWEAFVS